MVRIIYLEGALHYTPVMGMRNSLITGGDIQLMSLREGYLVP